MNVKELNDEQLEQLDKTLEAWTELTDSVGIRPEYDTVANRAFSETRKLQEMLQPKQYLTRWKKGAFANDLKTVKQMRASLVADHIGTIYEWQDGVGTVGEPITGEPLRKLLEGESK